MRDLKKALPVLMAASVMMAALTACGGSETEAETEAAAAETKAEAEASEGAEETAEETEASSAVDSIAILLPGYITDQSWNQGAYEGLLTLEEQGYEIAYTEDVQSADMESTFRTYCEDGYDFIIV